MAFSFGTLIVIFALAGSGYSLSCITCSSTTSSSCTGSSVVCSSGYSCGVVYTQSSLSGSVFASEYDMLCLPTNQCSKSGSISLIKGVAIKMASACCTTDNCTSTLPSLPSVSSSYNGVVCPTCTSTNSTWCSTPDTILCTGNENMCLLQAVTLTGSTSLSTALRGCATQSICDIGSLTSSISGLTSVMKYTCTSGGGALQHTFLPALIGLLLLKFLF